MTGSKGRSRGGGATMTAKRLAATAFGLVVVAATAVAILRISGAPSRTRPTWRALAASSDPRIRPGTVRIRVVAHFAGESAAVFTARASSGEPRAPGPKSGPGWGLAVRRRGGDYATFGWGDHGPVEMSYFLGLQYGFDYTGRVRLVVLRYPGGSAQRLRVRDGAFVARSLEHFVKHSWAIDGRGHVVCRDFGV